MWDWWKKTNWNQISVQSGIKPSYNRQYLYTPCGGIKLIHLSLMCSKMQTAHKTWCTDLMCVKSYLQVFFIIYYTVYLSYTRDLVHVKTKELSTCNIILCIISTSYFITIQFFMEVAVAYLASMLRCQSSGHWFISQQSRMNNKWPWLLDQTSLRWVSE